MLSEPEKNSLKIIFERVTPSKITGVIETLAETYKQQYDDENSKQINEILQKAINQIKRLPLPE